MPTASQFNIDLIMIKLKHFSPTRTLFFKTFTTKIDIFCLHWWICLLGIHGFGYCDQCDLLRTKYFISYHLTCRCVPQNQNCWRHPSSVAFWGFSLSPTKRIKWKQCETAESLSPLPLHPLTLRWPLTAVTAPDSPRGGGDGGRRPRDRGYAKVMTRPVGMATADGGHRT